MVGPAVLSLNRHVAPTVATLTRWPPCAVLHKSVRSPGVARAAAVGQGVAAAPTVEDVSRVLGVVLHLRAQVAHVEAQVVELVHDVAAPDAGDDGPGREHAALRL